MEAKFCLTCGSALEKRNMDGTVRMACTACSFVHWGNYSVGVGALVVKEEKILLVRRAQEPGKGYWTNPGGYIEQHELIEETIQREVLEEAGVEAVIKSVVAVRDQPRSIHNVYIAFSMDYVSGDPIPDGVEVDAAGFFSIEEMATMNVAGFTKWLVHIALQPHTSEGLTPDKYPIVPLDGYGLFRAN
ncbi:NUDIX hydrolase [Paenibacillus baekrokdamisoli]|uniref:NUDIX hydrolase n=1 Tax=Paenibacillus baekrokdamisoli TaxID=1712516 RepID=A0A3G9JAI9_9BACL|nr:NUDIX domain-containing protein [Paenibacillus baekrokdamisoli]MBB3071989.1 ADP-ribose pyrophosphatase YjhB (NUDIX family) [Paenibacillus baekrokdamisoli]BBH20294.1 NUDIX hydrolase [Paenibacillus baekrokdamisoli]